MVIPVLMTYFIMNQYYIFITIYQSVKNYIASECFPASN